MIGQVPEKRYSGSLLEGCDNNSGNYGNYNNSGNYAFILMVLSHHLEVDQGAF